MLFLALSSLQGRPLRAAAAELLALGPDGLQLTPGNVPATGDAAWLDTTRVRSHHGFSWCALRQRVWASDGALLVRADSVHPPRDDDAARAAWWPRLDRGDYAGVTFETMYPGYALGDGAELERAMDLGVALAVDVSHVFLQIAAGALTDATWRRLQTYDHVAEVHVSANDGRRDRHQPISPATFGLAWARDRSRAGTPVILECYMHKLTTAERMSQIDCLRERV